MKLTKEEINIIRTLVMYEWDYATRNEDSETLVGDLKQLAVLKNKLELEQLKGWSI